MTRSALPCGGYVIPLCKLGESAVGDSKRKEPTALRVADARVAGTAAAMLSAIQLLRKGHSAKTLLPFVGLGPSAADALGIVDKFGDALAGKGVSPEKSSFLERVEAVYAEAATQTVIDLRNVPVAKATVGVEMRFDLKNARSIEFLKDYNFSLVLQVSTRTIEGIRQAIADGQTMGLAPRKQAERIAEFIGLTVEQANAVDNYRYALQLGNYQDALRRQLRDKRSDRTLQRNALNGTKLTAAQIDKLVGHYEDRMIRYRAMMIARTETLRAANYGTREAWLQAQEQKLIAADAKKILVITRDERLCEFCLETKRINAAGVLLSSPFMTPSGPMDGPPFHPHCRCTIALAG